MQRFPLLSVFTACAVLLAGAVHAASTPTAPNPGRFNPLQTFAPFAYQYPVNRYRSASGIPGPDYWQNRADYAIRATLDPATKMLSASEIITYTNHSPDTLHMLWLQLDQNRYRTDARGNFSGSKEPDFASHTDGYRLKAVEVAQGGAFENAHYQISDTRMRVDLPHGLKPKDGTLRLRIVYDYTVPSRFGGRTDWYATKNGDVYEIAQWFPRMAVYDDLRGWDTLPYLNNEFYLEYGDIDYRVTVPANMIVAGSGELVNPDAVLSKAQRERLAKARGSEKTVMIRTPAEVEAAARAPQPKGTKTWHFRMHDTRDVAFGASAAYVWDAARIDLPSGKHAMAMSVYPVESLHGKGHWQDSTQFVKHTIEYFSKRWFEYPWPNAIAEAGQVGGMEYPGIAFDWWKLGGKPLFGITTHEVGHFWFPMIVGFNERRAAWMDEGFNTYVDMRAALDYEGGKYAPKCDAEYAPKCGNPVDEIQSVLDDADAPPILTKPDMIREKYRHPVTYFKSALGLNLLREQILGPERFDVAFRRFVHAWAFKHPTPSDFFRAMDSGAGEDLSWFWNGWYRHNWSLDMAVTGVRYIGGKPANGASVTVANLDRLVMPATLRVTYVDGTHVDVRVPVATWLQHHRFDVLVPGDKAVKSATIDPDHAIPDGHRGNNTFTVH
ncbi:M1 family metallopeptidase [Oleiagrimonas citrea]|uniref:M1 family metallopeptidase n=1 Tax=Oleiagrimonas citrea TaxID=1665687 RepID=A0A846ZKQ3_9GAMM|nr:M1 family metallopeptidase [Oleiagrimonas citrea]NKZ38895.1 M1 family metallopeptidase [Oleiagrimonas citrea]